MTVTANPLTSESLSFDDSAEVFDAFLDRGWTDGLPIVPPTPERVSLFLEHAGRSPSEIVGAEPTKGRVITAEKVAINAVMAGCLPEYLPVVLAAVEAISEPEFNLHAVSVSTMGAAVLTVVNGPIAKELSIRSGVDVFGPGNRANATIGRAISLVMSNTTGATGDLDKATLGHAGKYTWCIAEAEDVSAWKPLHVERGFSADQSTVTVFPGLSPIQVGPPGTTRPERILAAFGDALFASGPGHDEILVVLSPEGLGHIRSAGWSKERAKQALFEAGRRKASAWAEAGAGVGSEDPDAIVGVANSASSITLIVAGGAAGGACAVVPLWGSGANSVPKTREIKSG